MLCFILISGSYPVAAVQSLVEAARREAERRNMLEELGIEETVIEGNGRCYAGEGNVSISAPSEVDPKPVPAIPSSSKNQSSLGRYRAELQKLDQNIRKEEARLRKLQDRLQSLKRENLKIGDSSRRSRNEESQKRTQEQIEELQVDLKLLQKERAEAYDSGKKDGFLPGELVGKGIIP